MKPDVAFYYPGQYWHNSDWIKNLICFFDGIALLIPSYMPDYSTFDDESIVTALKECGLFHVIRPEEAIDAEATQKLAKAFGEIIASGRLDGLMETPVFSSLSMSRLGYNGDQNLANSIFEDLKSRGLAADSEDGVSIPMHQTVRALILVLLAQILRFKEEDRGLRLSPATDQVTLVDALDKIISKPESSSPTVGNIVSFDMTTVGVDLSKVPVDEILDFRQQNYRPHRDYIQSVRDFARELSHIPEDERQVKYEQRQEELKALSDTLGQIYKVSWRKPISFAIGCAGAAWTYQSGDLIAAALAIAAAAIGNLPEPSKAVDVYSYLFSTKQRF